MQKIFQPIELKVKKRILVFSDLNCDFSDPHFVQSFDLREIMNKKGSLIFSTLLELLRRPDKYTTPRKLLKYKWLTTN